MTYRRIVFSITYLLVFVYYVAGFNLSPQPNYIFKEPIPRQKSKNLFPKIQSSYFGYSINLRSKSVMVGAPRAQPLLEIQRKINESGAIYKCSFDSLNCEPFVVDRWGNAYSEHDEEELNSELKDNQWLGASMDGNTFEGDRFVVCAPRMMTKGRSYGDYLMHGVCYQTADTLKYHSEHVKKIAPLRKKNDQFTTVGDDQKYFYMLGEQGISVHITENDEEILVGAPGVFEWKGTVIRCKAKLRRNTRKDFKFQNDFEIAIPNPAHWNQGDDSYFGYALASGYFEGPDSHKILYVASAPQANIHQGEVYIFDIVDHLSTEKSIQIYYNFTSTQMGEYFGYALVADDFNGDGFYDLAICAPFYSKENSYENGAVYIYQNLGESTPGKWSSNFVLKNTLLSDHESGGRFGSSISRLGDINQDGYKDIAIGAPYEDVGAVYIYLGGPKGMNSKPSQRLTAPYNANVEPFIPQMFGHALSKGSDIDRNKYLDLAVGAPNAETVYVYRSYPVVRIIGKVNPQSKELKINDTSVNFKVCWSLESRTVKQTSINIIIKLDEQFKRVNFLNKLNHLEMNGTVTSTDQCQEYDVVVKFSSAHVFKPIDIDMHYSVMDKIPDSGVFCSKCVAVDPSDSNVAQSKIVFITGCDNPKCIADLKLTSTVLNPLPYKIGSSTNISITYKIENFGESAYLTQINITIPGSVTFMKTPSSCQLYDGQMLCNINKGSPLKKGDSEELKVSLDTTKIDGAELLVQAKVISTGDESNDTDNHANDIIPLAEFSDVEIIGKSNKPLLTLQGGLEPLLNLQGRLELENISYTYEIRNNGPTYLKHIDIVLLIPILYQINTTMLEDISVKSEYNNQQFVIEWVQYNSTTFQNPNETSSRAGSISKNNNGMEYEPSEMIVDDFVADDGSVILEHTHHRRNANSYEEPIGSSNRYTRSVSEENFDHRNVSNHDDINLKNLITNRTILFECYNSTTSQCVQAKFSVNNFGVGIEPIRIELKFSIDLNKIDEILSNNIDSFLIRPTIELFRTDDKDGKKMHVVQSYAYTIIWKQGTIDIWVFIVSTFAGLLTLILMTYGLYKLGFFRRAKKEELKVLVRQSQAQAMRAIDKD